MYTHEIENLLKLKDYILTFDESVNIMESSSQIYRLKFENNDGVFSNYSFTDDTERRIWFKIKNYNK